MRQWGLDEAQRVLDDVLAGDGRDLGVVGFGLGGDESAGPADHFAPLFADVRGAGLGITIHAGETAGAASVAAAVEVCGATRVGHGVAAAADPAVLGLLRERAVFVELCPGSNLRTGVVADLAVHPWPRFLESGIACCLNTDDRGLFALDLATEYRSAASLHGLGPAAAALMQRQALDAAFCAAPIRDGLRRRLTGGS